MAAVGWASFLSSTGGVDLSEAIDLATQSTTDAGATPVIEAIAAIAKLASFDAAAALDVSPFADLDAISAIGAEAIGAVFEPATALDAAATLNTDAAGSLFDTAMALVTAPALDATGGASIDGTAGLMHVIAAVADANIEIDALAALPVRQLIDGLARLEAETSVGLGSIVVINTNGSLDVFLSGSLGMLGGSDSSVEAGAEANVGIGTSSGLSSSGQVLAEPLVVLTVSYQYGTDGALIGAIYEPACIIVGDVVLTLLEVADVPVVQLSITDQPLVLLETSDHRC